jgi:hypothetical protein
MTETKTQEFAFKDIDPKSAKGKRLLKTLEENGCPHPAFKKITSGKTVKWISVDENPIPEKPIPEKPPRKSTPRKKVQEETFPSRQEFESLKNEVANEKRKRKKLKNDVYIEEDSLNPAASGKDVPENIKTENVKTENVQETHFLENATDEEILKYLKE